MSNKVQVGVRYCGGCNPRYDRVAVIKRLAALLPEVEFVTAQSGTAYPAVVVVAGCMTDCARTDDIAVPSGHMARVRGWEDLLPTRDFLKNALAEKEECTLTPDEVKAILPHREPMLFIDSVKKLIPGVEVTATYEVRRDLDVFRGHFPEKPVFPGALTVEAIAQAADILLLSLERYRGKTPLFMGIRKANFRKIIEPGAVMEIYGTLQEERFELGWATCRGQVFVEGELMADAEVILALR